MTVFRRFAFLPGALAFLVFLSGVSSLSGPAGAASSAWWNSEQVQVRLIAASNAVGGAAKLRLGLEFRMKPDWKIYWRSPGDAGFPPRPDWAGSENMAEARIDWPAPDRFEVLGLQTMGYKKEVVLPVTVSPFEAGKPVRLRARIPFLACSEICIPYEARLAFALPAGPETSSPEQRLIDRYAALVPKRRNLPGLTLGRIYVSGAAGSQALLVDVVADRPIGNPDLFIEGPEGVSFGRPVLRRGADGRQALLRVATLSSRDNPPDLAGGTLTFTLVDGARAIERRAAVAALPPGLTTAPPAPSAGEGYGLALILLFALAGGLILNLMPCVLPVLSIKLLSVIGHAGGESGPVRHGFLASAAGILASFLVLGTVAVALKSAGLAAGWGIQFQQPVFLVAMVAVLVLFSANMWGMFEINLPGAVGDKAAQAGSGKGLGSHFLTGAFATLLATPCSAPFLGTAVGFALSRTAAEIYAVFTALGIGLALPYLAVAAMPHMVTRLPKPGPWMVTLRRVLGIALIGTALWLISVLSTLSGLVAAGLVAALMAAALVALWQLHGLSSRARRASWGTVTALVVMALVSVQNFAPAGADAAAVPADEAKLWQPFDRAQIAAEVRLGRVVFVDVTADWCITCQVNKTLVLRRGEVAERLRGDAVTAMKADWTRPDPRIAEFLAHFGRYGIPFNVVYGPGAPGGIALPEILTDAAVLGAFERAGKAPATAARR